MAAETPGRSPAEGQAGPRTARLPTASWRRRRTAGAGPREENPANSRKPAAALPKRSTSRLPVAWHDKGYDTTPKLTGARHHSRTNLWQHMSAHRGVPPARPRAAAGTGAPAHGKPGARHRDAARLGQRGSRTPPPTTEPPPKRTAITLLARGLYVWFIWYKQLFIR